MPEEGNFLRFFFAENGTRCQAFRLGNEQPCFSFL